MNSHMLIEVAKNKAAVVPPIAVIMLVLATVLAISDNKGRLRNISLRATLLFIAAAAVSGLLSVLLLRITSGNHFEAVGTLVGFAAFFPLVMMHSSALQQDRSSVYFSKWVYLRFFLPSSASMILATIMLRGL